jgi:hypothetical protein
MKKFLIGLVIVLVVIGAIIIAVLTLTRGLPRSADEFFTLIRDGKARDAYLSASREFQASASEGEFANFLKNSGMADFKSASWSSRSVTNNIGELEGSLKTRAGGVIPIKIKLIKEDGRWKIHAIEKARAGLVETEAEKKAPKTSVKETAMPAEGDLKTMANSSLLLMARAIKAKDFSEFYNSTAKVWQSQTTPDALQESFQEYIENNVDMTFVGGLSPEFQEKPLIDENGVLVLQGAYPQAPFPLNFIVKYVRQDAEWKLVGIHIKTEEAPGGTASEAKGEIPPEEQVAALANRSMALLAQAVSRDDVSDFHASISALWRQQITPEALREKLSTFINKKISLAVTDGVAPVFSEKPYFDSDGLLVLKGRYPSRPYEVEFEFDYHFEDGQWELFGFNVQTRNPG